MRRRGAPSVLAAMGTSPVTGQAGRAFLLTHSLSALFPMREQHPNNQRRAEKGQPCAKTSGHSSGLLGDIRRLGFSVPSQFGTQVALATAWSSGAGV